MAQHTDTKSIGFSFVELQSVDSTNNYARRQIHAGLAQHGMAIFAHEQLAGKGQRGKNWSSEKGSNIILSIILEPKSLPMQQQFMLSAAVAVAVHDFFVKYAGSDTKIKWPNDLYWQDRKAGGLLIESGVGSRESGVGSPQPVSAIWEWCIVGIGININQTIFPKELLNPVSLKQVTGKDFNVIELAKELCTVMETCFQILMKGDYKEILERYTANLYKKDLPVKLKKGTRVFEAIIKSVSPSGKLIVQHAIEEIFDHGEVEWVTK